MPFDEDFLSNWSEMADGKKVGYEDFDPDDSLTQPITVEIIKERTDE